MSVSEQYANTVRQAQETMASMMESFASNTQKAFGQPVGPFGVVDPTAGIDQVFDFLGMTLEVQRDFAKKLAGVTASVGETVREQATSVGEAVREQATSAGELVREQAISVGELAREHTDAVQRAAQEQADTLKRAAQERAAQERAAQERAAQERAAQKYEQLTKVELADELDRRDLPKTGNVDELRARLIEDDRK